MPQTTSEKLTEIQNRLRLANEMSEHCRQCVITALEQVKLGHDLDPATCDTCPARQKWQDVRKLHGQELTEASLVGCATARFNRTVLA